MDHRKEQPGAGAGAATATSTDSDTGTSTPNFDHERLDVYKIAREFFVLTTPLMQRKMPREVRDQFDRAAISILSNIAEGASKTAKADKQRFYEIARGSTGEAAAQLDILAIRGVIREREHEEARRLLLRVAQMLSRLCGSPRTT